jgi:hypothetical protein
MPSITDLGRDSAQESQQNSSSSGSDDNEYERYDVSGDAFAKQHPTTAVRGEAAVLRYFPDWNSDQPDRGYFGLVLDDPSLVTDEGLEGSVIFQSTEDSGDDYKIVNEDDDATNILDTGVDFSGNLFYGEQTDSFSDDRIVLKATGSAGKSIASTLDLQGAEGARVERDEDGEVVLHDGGFPQHNGGLTEYHPEGRDGERPRTAVHDTELRPDVVGRDVVVMLQRLAEIDPDYDGDAYWATVLASVDEERQGELTEGYAEDSDKDPEDFVTEIDGTEFVQLEPTAEFERSEEIMRAAGTRVQWNRPDLEEMNRRRVEEGFDVYLPSDDDGEPEMTVEEALPDGFLDDREESAEDLLPDFFQSDE